MKSFFRVFFASLLAIVVVLAVVVGVLAVKVDKKPKIEDHSFLVVDIYGEILEFDPPSGVMGEVMGGKPETLQRILSNLEKVCVDDRIDGVIMKLSSSNNARYAKIEEIRGAIKKVQESGKKVYGFYDSIDRKTYFLASVCDSIFMPPSAFTYFVGFYQETEHVKNMLDKLGIKPNLHQIKDYKSAAELVTRTNMSPASRENKEWMLDEHWDVFVETMRTERGIGEEKIIELMNHALFTAEEAKKAGLVDGILYWDEIEDRLKREDGDELRTVSQSTYAQVEPKKLGIGGKKKIAVVHAQGMIGGRKSKIDPLFGVMMGHESVIADLRRARDDDDVAAVVFRIDSPGGEGLASDLISREVAVTADVKPIVASMVDLAASGGYYIAYTASKIVADPLTITGSIGSISMKFNMKGLYDKLGITHDYATRGPMALFYSENRDFTKEEWERFEQNHWDGFNEWLADVAKHRGMTFEEAEKLAHGRVWSGRQGEANGLVDELGGLDAAIELAKKLADIPAEEKVTVVHYPKKKGLLDMILGGNGSLSAAARWVVYRFIRDDLAETWRMLSQEPMYLMEDKGLE